jgi:hypothetical protein
MSFFDKVKKSAADAADTVKEGVEDLKTKNDVVRTYEELGRKTFELVDKGKLKNSTLTPFIKHIRELKAKLEASNQADWNKKS